MTKQILLIEDDQGMRENTAEILELSNYKVKTANDGKEGIQIAKNDPADLIICDIMMPGIDGFGVLHSLSKDPETASIPFIFLTAKAEKSDMRKGMEHGADDYLTKPFEEMDLLNAVESRLKRSETLKEELNENGEADIDQFIIKARGMEQLQDLSEDREMRYYNKKDMIFKEEEYPRHLFYIVKGKVKTSTMNEEGKEYVTGMQKSGDFLGYTALLKDSKYEETAVTLESTEISIIPKKDFLSLVYNDRDVSANFIKMLSNNLMDKEKKLLELAYDSVRMRVAKALLQLVNKYNEKDEWPYSLSLSREDLAGMVGTSTETVILTLSEFKEEEKVGIKGRKIEIPNKEVLENMKF
ncbi:MAG: response regulator [Flavobacteriales bacterium]